MSPERPAKAVPNSQFLDDADRAAEAADAARLESIRGNEASTRAWTCKGRLSWRYYNETTPPAIDWAAAWVALVTEFLGAIRALGRGEQIDRLDGGNNPARAAVVQLYHLCDRGGQDAAAAELKGWVSRPSWRTLASLLMTTIPDELMLAEPPATLLSPDAKPGEGEEDDADEGEKDEAKDDGGREHQFIFAPDGDGYFISAFGASGHFKTLNGFQHLAKLIQAQGKSVTMVELVRGTVNKQPTDPSSSKQPVMDETYKRQAQESWAELIANLNRARDNNDQGEINRLTLEKETLENQMKAAVGIGGRDRDMNNEANKLRPRIHGDLNRAYDAIRKANPPMLELATHLKRNITSVEVVFAYNPVPPLPWCFDKSQQ